MGMGEGERTLKNEMLNGNYHAQKTPEKQQFSSHLVH